MTPYGRRTPEAEPSIGERAADGRPAGHPLPRSDVDAPPRFEVRCVKPDGVRRAIFKVYRDRAQAEVDLAGLLRWRIAAELVEIVAAADVVSAVSSGKSVSCGALAPGIPLPLHAADVAKAGTSE